MIKHFISKEFLVALATHALSWFVLLAVYFFVAARVKGVAGLPDNFFIEHSGIGLVINLLFFYVLYIFLTISANRYPLIRVVSFSLIIVITFIAINVILDLFFISYQWFNDPLNLSRYLVVANVIVKLWFAFIAIFTFLCLVLLKRTIQANVLKLATLEADLALLKSQTHPHFLFNTLNSLYVSSYQFGDIKTAEGIGKMSAILRYMLHKHNESHVPLSDEITLISDYIDLQTLRFTENLSVNFNYLPPDELLTISPMILIVFVENAFKYGIKSNETSRIDIDLQSDAERIIFVVSNTNHEQSIKSNKHYKHSGFGIANLQQRLAIIYPNKHKLTLTRSSAEFKVYLELSLC